MSGWFHGQTSTKQRVKCLVQRHNTLSSVRLIPVIPWSPVQHSTNKPLRSSMEKNWIQSLYDSKCLYTSSWFQKWWNFLDYGKPCRRRSICSLKWGWSASTPFDRVCLFCLIWFFMSLSTIFQLCQDGSSWVEPVRINVSCSRTQCSDDGEAQTHNPPVSSQALYH